MAKAKTKKAGILRDVDAAVEAASGISAVEVEGFKSIRDRTKIAVKPLTILAGANSSGKSSIMQPLLLMKQTLEAPSDPGVFLLDGPNVRFTAAHQVVSRFGKNSSKNIVIGFCTISGRTMVVSYKKLPKGGFDITAMMVADLTGHGQTMHPVAFDGLPDGWSIAVQERCFLAQRKLRKPDDSSSPLLGERQRDRPAVRQVRSCLLSMIHVPAMHGNPERTYKVTAAGPDFPGTFEPYVASIIHHWQVKKDPRLPALGAALQKLGLNWKVEAARVDDTRFELRVGRPKRKTAEGARDLVSLADVGFGVSQCLPVLVALLTAQPGQLVYIEEPEMHLHPRAQVALAQILADAANRGVRVVVETHSSLLLLGVQALVAEGALAPELVALHWFSLAADGATEVRSADLDDAGAFGDWPEDFDEVTLDAQSRYLDAAEKRLAGTRR
jgi:predicted ATPase